MSKDEETRLEVLKEINSERRISNPKRIEVTVKDGVVTLSGYVDHYMDLVVATHATECVAGVEGVVQDLEVELPESSKRDDLEITRASCAALEHNSTIPANHVKVSVRDGWVTLEGNLTEEHQKEEAEATVSRILGVRGIINNVVIHTQVKPFDVTLQIERAFQHMAIHHARAVKVDVHDNKVILSGIVRAWIEKAEAEEAARELQGVTEVENLLEVTPLLEGKENPPISDA
jgi:osmotically-inducible protein OsmY